MKLYKIRNKDTGLFVNTSSWSGHLNYSPIGRVFTRINFVKSHIKSMSRHNKDLYENHEIVEYDVSEKQSWDI